MARSPDEAITEAMAEEWCEEYPYEGSGIRVKPFPTSLLERLKAGETFAETA